MAARMLSKACRALLVVGILLAPLVHAQVSCSSLDPITGACVSVDSTASKGVSKAGGSSAGTSGGMILLPARPTAPGEVSAPPGQYGALGGMAESSGMYLCGVYDEKTKKCVLRQSSAEQRERALQAGLEIGMEGLRVQQEVNLRVRAMGLMGPAPAALTMPIGTSAPAAEVVTTEQGEAAAIEACFNKKLIEMGKRSSSMPSEAELQHAMTSCK